MCGVRLCDVLQCVQVWCSSVLRCAQACSSDCVPGCEGEIVVVCVWFVGVLFLFALILFRLCFPFRQPNPREPRLGSPKKPNIAPISAFKCSTCRLETKKWVCVHRRLMKQKDVLKTHRHHCCKFEKQVVWRRICFFGVSFVCLCCVCVFVGLRWCLCACFGSCPTTAFVSEVDPFCGHLLLSVKLPQPPPLAHPKPLFPDLFCL